MRAREIARITRVDSLFSPRYDEIYFDVSRWASDEKLTNGEHIIPAFFRLMKSYGVDADPVIGYDRWSDPSYSRAIKDTFEAGANNRLIRLDREAIDEDFRDPEFLAENISNILEGTHSKPAQCILLFDLEDVSKTSIAEIVESIELGLEVLGGIGFRTYSICGCSLTAFVSDMVKKKYHSEEISRRELIAWKILQTRLRQFEWFFSDYGVISPRMPDESKNAHANGKIRYTIPGKHVVWRGESKQHTKLTAQYPWLAGRVLNSEHYTRPGLSWGDQMIMKCTEGAFRAGPPWRWISIETNHHLVSASKEIKNELRTVQEAESIVEASTD